jgi:cytochrome c556
MFVCGDWDSQKRDLPMGRPAGAALAAAFLVLGVGAVIAQSDPIATRMGLMKGNNDNAKVTVGMMRGQVPFDAAKVEAAFAQWSETAQKLPSLFPDNSKSGQNTRAAPKIWMTKGDFDAKAAAFGKVVAENRDKAKGSVDGLRAAIPAVADACDACHKDYRLTKQ